MRYRYITKIEIKFDKKKTFKRKSIKYLQKIIFQESVKLPRSVDLEYVKGKHGPFLGLFKKTGVDVTLVLGLTPVPNPNAPVQE